MPGPSEVIQSTGPRRRVRDPVAWRRWTGVARARTVAGVLATVPVALVVLAGRHVVRRVVVEGGSMLPTLEPGDRLIVVRTRRPRVGELVALPDPREPDRLLVKRVVARHGPLLELRGDNPDASTDSRSFGPVPAATVWGRVVRRYAPAARAGPLA